MNGVIFSILRYVYVALSGCTLLFVSWIIFRYMQHKRDLHNYIFYPGLLFFIITGLTVAANIYHLLNDFSSISFLIKTCIYGTHFFLLIINIFIRIIIVFNGTAHQISACTIKIYIFWACMCPTSVCAIIYTFYEYGRSALYVVVAICNIEAVCVLSSLSFLFVSKVSAINNMIDGSLKDDNTLMTVMSKNSLLAIVSNITTFVAAIGFLILSFFVQNGSRLAFITSMFIELIDCLTNFMCVWLSFKCFHAYYFKICGQCDAVMRTILKCKGHCSLTYPEQSIEKHSDPDMRIRPQLSVSQL